MKISCVICVYNEADRIQNILKAVTGHPALSEIIVVNDGSTDGTQAILRGHDGIRLITYPVNRGKTYALGRGIAAAAHETLMLLDSDLSGITAADITSLAQPVVTGRSDVSLSLRRNSLGIYRLIGLDFVTGERVIPASLFPSGTAAFDHLPRWGAEVYMNECIIRQGLRIAVVDWPNVYNVRKYRKIGLVRGLLAEIGMIRDALSVLPLSQVASQNMRLLRKKVRLGPPVAAAWRFSAPSSFRSIFLRTSSRREGE